MIHATSVPILMIRFNATEQARHSEISGVYDFEESFNSTVVYCKQIALHRYPYKQNT